jgi:hypothetical protein
MTGVCPENMICIVLKVKLQSKLVVCIATGCTRLQQAMCGVQYPNKARPSKRKLVFQSATSAT